GGAALPLTVRRQPRPVRFIAAPGPGFPFYFYNQPAPGVPGRFAPSLGLSRLPLRHAARPWFGSPTWPPPSGPSGFWLLSGLSESVLIAFGTGGLMIRPY
ncbi:hypothetical protein ACFQ07_12685, partial [Actinomadura adrarensis]